MSELTIPIYTVIDGYVASVGTLISVCGNKIYIGKNAYMLIRELRSGVWGGGNDLFGGRNGKKSRKFRTI